MSLSFGPLEEPDRGLGLLARLRAHRELPMLTEDVGEALDAWPDGDDEARTILMQLLRGDDV